MNGVPGVMQFESNGSPAASGSPFAAASAFNFSASNADLNLLLRCWFIFARGATPSMAMYNNRLGRTIRKMWSRYANTLDIICCRGER